MASLSPPPHRDKKPRVLPCSHPLVPPEFYRTQPPPHHPRAKGNKGGIYRSPWASAGPEGHGGLLDFLRTRLFDWEQATMPDAIDLPKTNPCTWTTAEDGRDGMSPQDEQDKILCTWIGHAGCHFQIPVPGSTCGDRITVLTDPVLSQRCSPVQFMGPARLQKAPTTVEEMASSSHSHVWPDVLVISHNHYDHLDYNTIKAIVSCDKHPVPHIFCTLGVAKFFYALGVAREGVTELDWWGERRIDLPPLAKDTASTRGSSHARTRSLKLTCVPAQHFSGRSTTDRNATLWGGWVMQALPSRKPDNTTAPGKKIYFAGDTAYRKVDRAMVMAGKDHDMSIGLPACPAFKEIGELLGPLDLSMIPIGAYKPRAFMSAVHVDPVEAVHIHQEVRSKQSIAIHWGVFPLAAEGPNEPRELLADAVAKAGVAPGEFGCMGIGETRAF